MSRGDLNDFLATLGEFVESRIFTFLTVAAGVFLRCCKQLENAFWSASCCVLQNQTPIIECNSIFMVRGSIKFDSSVGGIEMLKQEVAPTTLFTSSE